MFENIPEKYFVYDVCKLNDYPEHFSKDNESVLGRPIIENPEILIFLEFCALKAKGCADRFQTTVEKLFRRNIIRTFIYELLKEKLDCLLDKFTEKGKQFNNSVFRNLKHSVFYKKKKETFCSFEDVRKSLYADEGVS